MKKIILLLAICLCFMSCGPALKENGQFGSQTYIGNFRDIAIYEVETPGGSSIYIGVRGDGEAALTQYTTGGKTPHKYSVILIDGKQVTTEEAKKILEEAE